MLLLSGGYQALSDNAALIGAVVALGGVFTTQMVSIALDDRRSQQARDSEQAQRARELEVAEQRAQDDALQQYLDQISQLVPAKDLPLDEVAQARTLAVLRRLDPQRKRYVVDFLAAMQLSQSSQLKSIVKRLMENIEEQHQHQEGKIDDTAEIEPLLSNLVGEAFEPSHHILIPLKEADLRNTDLRGIELANVDMSYADLRGANLDKVMLANAKLVRVNLSGATLRGTHLSGANLNSANLNNADLSGANLADTEWVAADLRYAALRDVTLAGANMAKANLQGADLTGVELLPRDLTEANMLGAKGITDSDDFLTFVSLEQIALTGATMPNGQKYEDWLEDKERHSEDGGNSGTS
jgi:uncharacterized protein YjbI with pentapeptide repeats